MRIAIVDDDRLVCASLKVILGAQEDVDVVGLGCDGDEAVRLYADERPDVMLMDIQMPGRDGLSAAQEILKQDPQARIVFLTTFSDDDYIVRALRYGARGYLVKQDVSAIAPALRAVMSGQSVLEGEVLAKVSFAGGADAESKGAGGDGGASEAATPAAATAPAVAERLRAEAFPQLTDREFEVVRLIAEGLDNREIAATACMGEGTVRNHVSAVLSKLGLKNRTQIAVAYYRAAR